MIKSKFLLTTKEAAIHVGVSIATIYRMEKRGLIVSSKTPGGQRRFSKDVLEKYLKNSYTIEAPQNPSKYKKNEHQIRETLANYKVKFSNPYYHKDSIWIYNDDILTLNSIENKSIDLIVTSPPYNIYIKYNSHDDTMSYDDYLSFTKKWLERVMDF